ncbi:MAG: lipoyl(octanoyl) transferase LipB [Capsulimonadales bacterium]|nr:lipoyl(octanoyl) transferase LipB [Capsulimonadales bacterium]
MPLTISDRVDEGPIPYRDAWQQQKELVARRQRGEGEDTLILLTHPPTVTFGKAADRSNLLLTFEEYRARGIEPVETDRGGDVTYHGPGQLVGYPILHLGEGRRDLHRYIRFLEAVLIGSVEDLGVRGAGRADFHAGVWVGDGYLAALGVRVSRWVTHHGFALNVTEEVRRDFETIVPCGVSGKRIATLEEWMGRPVSVRETADTLIRRFRSDYDRAVAGEAGPNTASASR